MTKSLNKKIDNNVKKILQSPSNEEKEVLNLFYEDSNITRYPHYYSNALESLIEKNVIQRKNEKHIEITQYGLNHLKKFRPDKAKLEVELGNHNILAPCNSGSGAAGGMRR